MTCIHRFVNLCVSSAHFPHIYGILQLNDNEHPTQVLCQLSISLCFQKVNQNFKIVCIATSQAGQRQHGIIVTKCSNSSKSTLQYYLTHNKLYFSKWIAPHRSGGTPQDNSICQQQPLQRQRFRNTEAPTFQVRTSSSHQSRCDKILVIRLMQ